MIQIMGDSRIDYNEVRPHSSLNYWSHAER